MKKFLSLLMAALMILGCASFALADEKPTVTIWTSGSQNVGDLFTALCDETIQLFVPGRSGQIADVWLDTAGYLTGALLTLLIFSLCRKRPKQRKTP